VFQELGIGRHKIRGGEHIEDLACAELHHRFVMSRHAAHVAGGIVPPLLLQKESMVEKVERPVLPGFAGEAAIPAAAVL
jgi:hypothetical protein